MYNIHSMRVRVCVHDTPPAKYQHQDMKSGDFVLRAIANTFFRGNNLWRTHALITGVAARPCTSWSG